MNYIGLDLGTHGIKFFVLDDLKVLEFQNVPIKNELIYREGFEEQNPILWKKNFLELLDYFKRKYPRFVMSISSTSGSILPVDKNGAPLYNAIMYNDSRSFKEADLLNKVGQETIKKLGYKFNSSFSLPKILWIKNNLKEVYKQTKYFLHPADYLVFLASGIFGVSDHSNSLKTGFDIIDYKWPSYIEKAGIEICKLPEVYPSGFRLNQSIVLGMTDGCASQIATGAFEIGSSAVSIGTTLVIKGVSKSLIPDEEGRFYYHLNFDKKTFLPGGASNSGGGFFEKNFSKDEIDKFSKAINYKEPASSLVYPLVREGERFPFIKSNFVGIDNINLIRSKEELFKAGIEGLAFISRYAFEMMENFAIDFSGDTFVVGFMFKYKNIMRIFSNILKKRVINTEYSDASFGSAIIAMLNDFKLNDLKKIMEIENECEPDNESSLLYEAKYMEFKRAIDKIIKE
jgi:sugar (pentulose or hexulose) kinase